MFSKNFVYLLIAAICAVVIVILGVSSFKHREDSTAPRRQSAEPMHSQAASQLAKSEATQTQTLEAKAGKSGPSVEDPAQFAAISTFRQWAETAAASDSANLDENKGMELAAARAVSMKALIQKNPAMALRQSLPAELRASLPPAIAAAIEQPVRKTGMVSIRMMCNHTSNAPHGTCESTPVLLEMVDSWNAHYGDLQWRTYLGQDVGFEGVAVERELAVRSITPSSATKKP